MNLNLTPHQATQAETQRSAADGTVTARLPETHPWLLVPVQDTPQSAITWEALRLSGTDALAARASKKQRSDELYLTSFASTRLKMELDRVPLWRGAPVGVRQLVEDFARYPYLPRLKDPSVLLHAVSDGLSLLTWERDSFAFADGFDEVAGRYKGLRGGQLVTLLDAHAPGLVVKPEVASWQLDAERAAPAPGVSPGTSPRGGDGTTPGRAGVAGPANADADPGGGRRPGGALGPVDRPAGHPGRVPRRLQGTLSDTDAPRTGKQVLGPEGPALARLALFDPLRDLTH